MAIWRQPANFAARARRRLPLWRLGAAAATALLPLVATGQELELRGGLSETAVAGSLLSNGPLAGRGSVLVEPDMTAQQDQAASRSNYQPASEGAGPEETAPPDRFDLAETPALSAAGTDLGRQPRLRAAVSDDLPPDAVETRAIARTLRASMLDDELMLRAGPENRRVAAIGGREPQRETEPYAPLGLRLGSFNIYGAFDQGTMWTSNVDSSPNGGEGVVSETTLRLSAVSDWSRHSARLEAQGLLRESISGAPLSEFRGDARAALDFDLASDFALRAGLGYAVRPESASSPVEIAGIASQPTTQSFLADLSLEKRAGRHRFEVAGSLEREIYSDAELTTGAALSQEDRNYKLALLSLRTGYELSPALVPFLEAEIGRRFYDLDLDAAGYARSGELYGLAAGLEWDLGEKLRGELSAGWVEERFDDDRLMPISGPSLAAAIDWSPWRGTTLGLTGTTVVEGSTTPGESGSIQYAGLIQARREIRANLTAEAGLGAAWRDYSGSSDHEVHWLARAGGTWWLNRYAGLDGRLEHERFTSTLPGREYRTTSAYLGLKLQR